MEHRLSKRVEVSLDVIVRGRDGLTLHGRTRDVSAGGMFVHLGQRLVSASKSVEIELVCRGCLRGLVVHVGDEGVGVMFRSLDSSERHLLGQLLSKR